MVAALIRMGLGAVTVPILIRILGAEEYGLWSLASAVVNIVALADAGLSMSTTVFVSQDMGYEDYSTRVSSTLTIVVGAMLILASVAAVGLWLTAPTLLIFFPNLRADQSLTIVRAFQLGAIVVWLRLLQQSAVGVEQAYEQYKVMNAINTLQVILTNAGLLVISYRGGHTIVLMQWLVGTGSVILLLHIITVSMTLRHMQLRIRWERDKAFAIASYSGITWFGALGGVLFGSLDRIIVGSFLGTAALGIYSAITNVATQINTLSALPVQPLLPFLSRKLSSTEKTNSIEIEASIRQALQINAVIAFGMGAALTLLAPLLMQLMMSKGYTPQDLLAFRLAAIIYAIYSVNAVGYFILFGLHEVRLFMLVQLCSGLLSLALIAIGARQFGLLGAIMGNAGYFGIYMLTLMGMAKLNISLKKWVGWLVFPSIWFVLFSILGATLVITMNWMIGLLFIQGIIILIWFGRAQNIKFDILRRSWVNTLIV